MKAAKEVYNTPELRQAILELMDGTTLAGMLRLEKAVTASVAAVLYKEVPRQLVNKMSRSTARRVTYCNAVKILDWSSDNLSLRITAFRNIKSAPPVRFHPETFLRQLATWKKKYPQLRTIRYQYPDRSSDDRYVVHLGGEKIVIELESRVDHYMPEEVYIEPATISFPVTPAHPMMVIHHTFVLHVIPTEYDISVECNRELYSNPKMDRRITGIESSDIWCGSQPELSLAESLAFLALRQLHDGLPLTQFEITGAYELDQIRELVNALGPSIRSIFFSCSTELNADELQMVTGMFDEAFPNLCSLHIEQALDDDSWDFSFRLSGLACLRRLTLSMPGLWGGALARLVSGLGKKDCVYLFDRGSVNDLKLFHHAVKRHRTTSISEDTDSVSDDSDL